MCCHNEEPDCTDVRHSVAGQGSGVLLLGFLITYIALYPSVCKIDRQINHDDPRLFARVPC